jgi:hypothetical protein
MSEIQHKLIKILQSTNRAKIWIEELEKTFEGYLITYEQFAEAVLALEQSTVLTEIKSAGRRARRPSLANRYRINHSTINSEHKQRIHNFRLELHPLISLDRYFSEGELRFYSDLPNLQKIHRYLLDNGLPTDFSSPEERSFALVGDEKWITEKNGRAMLERIGLWEKLRIEFSYEPLMMGINTTVLAHASTEPCLHLIVENKATFQALLPILTETSFHTLIYGCGNKIVGNMEMFSLQFPLQNREHRFYYFGDLDYKGIQIWHHLSTRVQVLLALPFYTACLDKPPVKGKTNQLKDDQALEHFLSCLSKKYGERLKQTLVDGGYFPQEILSSTQLRQIWRGMEWS